MLAFYIFFHCSSLRHGQDKAFLYIKVIFHLFFEGFLWLLALTALEFLMWLWIHLLTMIKRRSINYNSLSAQQKANNTNGRERSVFVVLGFWAALQGLNSPSSSSFSFCLQRPCPGCPCWSGWPCCWCWTCSPTSVAGGYAGLGIRGRYLSHWNENLSGNHVIWAFSTLF